MSDTKHNIKWGPQGSNIGIIEYICQSNDNLKMVPEGEKFKFIDDNTITEKVNLSSVGLASYNVKQHVPSNIATHNQIIDNVHLKSQEYMNKIVCWSDRMKMKLNPKKCNNLIFNFSRKNQFTTNIVVGDHVVETVRSKKLLGTIVEDKLKWNHEIERLIKAANKRMVLLQKVSKFTSRISDLKLIYNSKIRSILETSCVVWHSSITIQQRAMLERLQKTAFRIILKNSYESYDNALKVMNMDTLDARREKLCLRFAKSCLRHKRMRSMFPINTTSHSMMKRNCDKFKVNRAITERYKKSAIPYMQRMLNDEDKELQRMIGS